MITRFFRTSKPQHYFIFLAVLIGVYVFQRIRLNETTPHTLHYVNEGLGALALIGSFFLIVFIITKNNLTQNNSFAAAYFCFFSGLVPEVFLDLRLLGSNLFVLMACRRIFSMNTGINLKKKYYDSALWLCIAAIFYPSTILYFIPLLLSVALIQAGRVKHLLVIGLALATVGILGITSHFLFRSEIPWGRSLNSMIGFDFSVYKNPLILGAVALFLTLSIWAYISLFNQQFFKLKTRFTFSILVLIHLIGVAIPILSANKSVADCLFILFPMAVLSANLSEGNQSKWMPELIMTMVLLLIAFRVILGMTKLGLLY